MKRGFIPQGPPFDAEQKAIIKIHGGSTTVLMVFYGCLLASPVQTGLRSKRNRFLGLTHNLWHRLHDPHRLWTLLHRRRIVSLLGGLGSFVGWLLVALFAGATCLERTSDWYGAVKDKSDIIVLHPTL
jgi:hypothetical protein